MPALPHKHVSSLDFCVVMVRRGLRYPVILVCIQRAQQQRKAGVTWVFCRVLKIGDNGLNQLESWISEAKLGHYITL